MASREFVAGPIVQTIFARRAFTVRILPQLRAPGWIALPDRGKSARMIGFGRDQRGQAQLSGTPLTELVLEARVPTPAYFYDLDAIAAETRALVDGFGEARHVVAYAVKANSAGSVVRAIASAGGGADVVSGAELELVLACGVPADRVVISGVAKTDAEIDLAIARGILAIHAESVEELDRIAARARAAGKRVRVSLRVNPGVEIDSHSHIATGHDAAKFGIARADLGEAFTRIDSASDALSAIGISTHVGSLLNSVDPYRRSALAVCEAARARRSSGRPLSFVDFGGGFGIDYGGAPAPRPAEFARAGLALLKSEGLEELTLVVEPGRALVGPHGVIVASVVQGKRSGSRRWAMIDAGMNDLIRPALYGARHRIEPLDRPPSAPSSRVVGPVCESSDDFGEHELGDPLPVQVVIRDAGAYGFVMASEYNGRSMPAEVFVAAGRVKSVSPGRGPDAWVKSRLGA
jgi:diaminopimelate decarboxylase